MKLITPMPRRASATNTSLPVSAFLFYVLIVGAAVAVLHPVLAIFLGILPLSALLFNRAFVFQAPLRLLHFLFVAAMVLFILWPRYLAFNFGGPDLTPARLVYATLLGIWAGALVSPAFRRDLWSAIRESKFWIWLAVAYFVLRLFSSFFSDAPGLSLYQIANELFTAVLILPIVLSIYRHPPQIESMAFWIFLASVVVAGLAIVEWTLSRTLFSNVSIPGMRVDSEWLQNAVMDKVRAGKYRAQSTFSHPLLLAEFMMFALPLSLYVAAGKGFWMRSLGVAGLFLCLAGAVVTGSRSTLIALPPMMLLAVVVLATRQRLADGRTSALGIFILFCTLVGLFGFAVLFTFDFVSPELVTGRSALEVSSTTTRLQMLQQGVPLILERPLLGYGPGLSAYLAGVKSSLGLTIDSYYLSLALDSGLVCLIIFVLLTAGVAIKGFVSATRDSSSLGLLKGMMGVSLIGMLIIKSILSTPHNAPLIFLCIALILVPGANQHIARKR